MPDTEALAMSETVSSNFRGDESFEDRMEEKGISKKISLLQDKVKEEEDRMSKKYEDLDEG